MINNVILHNNRADTIKALFYKIGYINGSNIDITPPITPTYLTTKKPALTKLKSRRIRIIEVAKELSNIKFNIKKEQKDMEKTETNDDPKIGLECFDIISILGKGSFGEVYLVKYKPLNKPYAMKVLSKKRFLSQNLLKYAKAERDVLCYTKNPFIVGLDFAFQAGDKLFLILEYCPG